MPSRMSPWSQFNFKSPKQDTLLLTSAIQPTAQWATTYQVALVEVSTNTTMLLIDAIKSKML